MSNRVNIEHDRWWMVRAGEGGKLRHHFRRHEMAALGAEIPKVDLSGVPDLVALRERFASISGGAEFVESDRFQQVADFVLTMQEGDIVVTPSDSDVLIRTVAGPTEFHPDDRNGMHLQRRVRAGKRRDVDDALREKLSSPSIEVFRLSEELVAALRELVRPSRI